MKPIHCPNCGCLSGIGFKTQEEAKTFSANARILMKRLCPSWISVEEQMPDADLTVMVHHPDADEPVWLGFHDGEEWREVSGERFPVTHWAEMPAPPF